MAQRQGPSMDRLDHGPGHEPDDGQDPIRGRDAPSIGAELRDARLKLGQELADVASVLRIRRVFLEAIEEDHFDQLPGAPYATGFIRAYAGHLGLDADEVVRCFKEQASGLERQTDLAFPEVITESRIPRGAILLISVVLVVTAYGGWYYLSTKNISISEIIPAVPEKLASLVLGEGPGAPAPDAAPTAEAGAPEPATAPGAPDAGAGEQEAASAPVKEEEPKATAKPPAPAAAGRAEPGPEGSSPSEPAATSPPPPETASTSAPEPSSRGGAGAMPAATAPASQARSAAVAAAPTAPPAATRLAVTGVPEIPEVPRQSAALPERQPRVYGEGNSDSRVILRATRDSWIQVHGADDVLLLTRILRAGDSYRVPNRTGLTLMTGNAGALEILVDGEPVPPIGPFGAVRRDVSLDPNRLKTGSAAAN
ncbi:MAG: RodZ domain-containing protein [Alphaproteobacteria bacterium]